MQGLWSKHLHRAAKNDAGGNGCSCTVSQPLRKEDSADSEEEDCEEQDEDERVPLEKRDAVRKNQQTLNQWDPQRDKEVHPHKEVSPGCRTRNGKSELKER